jgi:hypothetical protein
LRGPPGLGETCGVKVSVIAAATPPGLIPLQAVAKVSGDVGTLINSSTRRIGTFFIIG